MKLLIATGLYPPESGGPATYTRLLEDSLPALGVEVSVLPFIRVRHLPPGVRHLAYAWRCFNIAKTVDVLFAQDTVSVGLPALLAARLARKKFVVRVPGDYAWEQGRQRMGVADTIEAFQTKRYGWRVELLRLAQRLVVGHALRVIVPSEYMRALVSHWGVRPERVERIYNGIRLPAPYTLPLARPEGFLISTIARLVPWKGVDGLIRIVAQEPGWQLIVVGDGPERVRLEALATSSGCAPRVHFMGQLPREQALGWAKMSDVFVLNSTYEGLSHTLIEVMSLGVPVLASSAGGNPEIVGASGVVELGLGDAGLHLRLQALEQDPKLASQAAQEEVSRVESFSIEHTLSGLVSLLHTL